MVNFSFFVHIDDGKSSNTMDKLAQKLSKAQIQAEQEDEEENGEDDEFMMADLSRFERFRISALENLDEEFTQIQKDYEVARVALEATYITRRTPVYEKRAKIIAGTLDVPHVATPDTPEAVPGLSPLSFLLF